MSAVRERPGFFVRWFKRLLFLIVVLAIAGAIPVLINETQCVAKAPSAAPAFTSAMDAADRRNWQGTYLTYPEWAIVHAYDDLSKVVQLSSESDYDYFGAIKSYWSGLCGITKMTTARGDAPIGSRMVLYVIGLSYSLEMAVEGAWEKTVGWLTVQQRGAEKTPEDMLAMKTAEDYAKFLDTKPWYEFDFTEKLAGLWLETPLVGGVRQIERRVALTMKYGFKALYAMGMKAAAGAAMPFSTRIRTLVADLDPGDAQLDDRIKIVGPAGGGTVIETERYKEFTQILKGLASRGRNFKEIAGNGQVLVSWIVPGKMPDVAGTAKVFEVPVQSRPGSMRVGLDVPVAKLGDVLRAMGETEAELELIYDFY